MTCNDLRVNLLACVLDSHADINVTLIGDAICANHGQFDHFKFPSRPFISCPLEDFIFQVERNWPSDCFVFLLKFIILKS